MSHFKVAAQESCYAKQIDRFFFSNKTTTDVQRTKFDALCEAHTYCGCINEYKKMGFQSVGSQKAQNGQNVAVSSARVSSASDSTSARIISVRSHFTFNKAVPFCCIAVPTKNSRFTAYEMKSERKACTLRFTLIKS